MKTIYIFTNGTTLRRVGRRLLLEKDRQRVWEMPLKDVGRILIYGTAEVTAQTLTALMEAEITLCYLRRSGRLKGKISPGADNHVTLRQRQYRLFQDNTFSIPLARSIIKTKLQNMEAVIFYLLRREQPTLEMRQPFHQAYQALPSCQTRDEIMGTEGAAAAHYFRLYGSHLPPHFQFAVRSRQPGLDPANSLLNLGYMTLLREVQSHIEAHHLDPYIGILHATQDGRPSLALDLMEEFRQSFVDIFVARLLRREQIQPEHFQKLENGAIEMTEEGLKKFFSLYEQHMGNQDGDSPNLRKMIDQQIDSLKKHILGERDYEHFQLDPNADSQGEL